MKFEFYNPTHLIFGAGTLSQLGEVVRKHGKKALIVIGGRPLRSIGCPTRLLELCIGDDLFSRYAEDAVLVVYDENGNQPGRPLMSKEDIVEVLRSAL